MCWFFFGDGRLMFVEPSITYLRKQKSLAGGFGWSIFSPVTAPATFAFFFTFDSYVTSVTEAV